MSLSQKCQYALRALLELAVAYEADQGPVKIAAIAERQAIPPRFLEVILNQLKQGGFVESRRGARGGYALVREPRSLSVGDVVRYVEGPIGPVSCVKSSRGSDCPLREECVFLPLWREVQRAVSKIYDGTSFAELAESWRHQRRSYVPNYVI